MTEIKFITADVFTDKRFGGNPLAVFPDPPHLSKSEMQGLARELNLSETVFVYPAGANHLRRLRIFTPAREVPFAGHPVVGTAIVLAQDGAFGEMHAPKEIAFECEAGRVPVRIERRGALLHATLTAPQTPRRVDDIASREDFARVVGLQLERLAHDIDVGAFSAGLPFNFVPVADRKALAEARIDSVAFDRHVGGREAVEVLVLTMDDWHRGTEIYARMFAPAAGIAEDPATGSAAAASAGFMHALRDPGDGTLSWTIHQGIEMGRPSLLSVSMLIEGGVVQSVHVGGTAVLMSRGAFVNMRAVPG